MNWILSYLWLVPVAPLVAAGLSALCRRDQRGLAASASISSMVIALALSVVAFAATAARSGSPEGAPRVFNFRWLQFGDSWLSLGWVLDPLSAVMLVMVCFVGLLIFVYSLGYMAHDDNFTRFFCFLSLFAAAMLGLVISNSLLLVFICWELVGLASYLLIGFWFQKPAAAAAAKKAFIVTRVGDLAFFLGMLWLYARTGTLLFYDAGNGCIEPTALNKLLVETTSLGFAASTGIALLFFCGAMGKSGQVPLHVWLPDAMEGPTPVSALIHAATMVAAGVFLVARVFPLFAAHLPAGPPETVALQTVTWVGTITAVFAASIAVAQTDIKRILAYSTVSQLGFMMMGLGMGGVAVGMFHLVTHAFFKALLFLGAGSVIHGCHGEQDIRSMGGLRKFMPITFATYAIGMLALSGFPLLFSGFWSKDEILHAAHGWSVSRIPFYLGVFGALLTAFYMTRQVCYVFYGDYRLGLNRTAKPKPAALHPAGGHSKPRPHAESSRAPHESPAVMTVPLMVLAAFTVLLGVFGTPAWPWFLTFLSGQTPGFHFGRLLEKGVVGTMLVSSTVVFLGLGLGYWLYGRKPGGEVGPQDVLERLRPDIYVVLRRKYFVDEVYEWSVVRFSGWVARAADWADRFVWGGVVQLVSYLVLGLAWANRFLDEYVLNPGFDETCRGFSLGGRLMSRCQTGRVQHYLRVIGVALAVFVLFLMWGCGSL